MVLPRIATLKERAAAALAEFLRLESAGGVLLLGMAMLGLAAANSPLAMLYGRLLSLPFSGQAAAALGVNKPLRYLALTQATACMAELFHAGRRSSSSARYCSGQFTPSAAQIALPAAVRGRVAWS